MEMVSLDPLGNEDLIFLRDRVNAHYLETDSALAARLLDRWDEEVRHFVKVMPDDYKRVMEAVRQAEITGEPVLDAIMAAAHG